MDKKACKSSVEDEKFLKAFYGNLAQGPHKKLLLLPGSVGKSH